MTTCALSTACHSWHKKPRPHHPYQVYLAPRVYVFFSLFWTSLISLSPSLLLSVSIPLSPSPYLFFLSLSFCLRTFPLSLSLSLALFPFSFFLSFLLSFSLSSFSFPLSLPFSLSLSLSFSVRQLKQKPRKSRCYLYIAYIVAKQIFPGKQIIDLQIRTPNLF